MGCKNPIIAKMPKDGKYCVFEDDYWRHRKVVVGLEVVEGYGRGESSKWYNYLGVPGLFATWPSTNRYKDITYDEALTLISTHLRSLNETER